MRSFNPQFDSPEIVLERHISVKPAAVFSCYRDSSRMKNAAWITHSITIAATTTLKSAC
jgi:hypothetical protein